MKNQFTPPNHKEQGEDKEKIVHHLQDENFFQVLDEIPLESIHTKINNSDFAIRFWHFSVKKKEDVFTIILKGLNKHGILKELESLGFFKRYDERENLMFIREIGNIISMVQIHLIKDVFFESCIKSQTENISIPFDGQIFIFSPESLIKVYLDQYHLIFNEGFLQHLKRHDKPILRDNKTTSYFFFNNVILKLSKQGKHSLKYSELIDECIWEDHISERNFKYTIEQDNSHYKLFIENVANHDPERIKAFKSAIGYLLHNFKSASTGQIVILYDEAPALKGQPEGGTGKGLFVNALKQIREISKIDGKKYQSDDKFKWQSVKHSTQIVWLDDVHSKFPFEDLHSNSTDGWNIERKHEHEIFIPHSESPKIVIASNTVLTTSGTTNKRRQFIIEFSDHYSKHIKTGTEEPISDEHGCIFFDDEDWNSNDWNMFFSFMVDCSEFYFKNGLQTYEFKGLIKNQILQGTNEDFADWIEENPLNFGERYNLKELFEKFKPYFGEDSDLKQRTFTNWLKAYSGFNNLKMEKVKSNGESFIILTKK